MQQVMDVETELLEVTCQLSRAIDVAADDMEGLDSGTAKRLLCQAPSHLVEVSADEDQRMFIQHLTTGRLLLNHRIQVLEECAVATTHVTDSLWLGVQWAVE